MAFERRQSDKCSHAGEYDHVSLTVLLVPLVMHQLNLFSRCVYFGDPLVELQVHDTVLSARSLHLFEIRPKPLLDFLDLRHAAHFWQQVIVFTGRCTSAIRVKIILFLQSIFNPGHKRHEFLILRCLA